MFNSLEQAVYTHLLNYEEITSLLAKWNDTPAVFNGYFPSDMDEGWNEQQQFPRIVFYIDWSEVPDRIISGHLVVFVEWLNSQFIQAEIIESKIKERLSNVFFNTSRGSFCCSWNTSEQFNLEGTEQIVNGVRMDFNVLAFPDQKTYLNPEPVTGLENYLKSIDPDLLILNRDPLPDIFIPEKPVIYVRVNSLANRGEDTYAYRFLDIQESIHIISVDQTLIRKTLGKLYQQIMLDGEFLLEDKSIFLITDHGTNLVTEYGNSSLLDGQFNLTGWFALNAIKDVQGIMDIKVESDIHYAD